MEKNTKKLLPKMSENFVKYPFCKRGKNKNTLQKRLLWIDEKAIKSLLVLHYLTFKSAGGG